MMLLHALLLSRVPAPCQGGWRAESERALARGASAILSHQTGDGLFVVRDPGDATISERYPMGVGALALHALLRAGLAADDPAIDRARRALRYLEPRRTYGVGALLAALEAQANPEDDAWIAELAAWLIDARDRESGLWAYPGGTPDLSNTQLALLGLWAAERRGHPVADELWKDALRATIERANRDGGFGYRDNLRPESAGTTTTAGLTILELALARLEGPRLPASLRRSAERARDRAWAWLDERFTPTGNPAHAAGRIRDRYPGVFQLYVAQSYYLYGLERVASLAGRAQVGGRDWYREGVIELLRSEFAGGGWGPLENSCLAVLFLARSTGVALASTDLPDFPRPLYWRSTNEDPAADWTSIDLDDAGWFSAAGAFGVPGAGPVPVRSAWAGGELWLRRRVEREQLEHLHLLASGEVEVFVDGHRLRGPAEKADGYTRLEIPPTAPGEGEALVAVHALPTEQPLLDLLFHEPDVGRDPGWWKGAPHSTVPFLRSWRVLGPIPDPHGIALLRDPNGAARELPRAGSAAGRARWRDHDSPGQLLDLETATAEADDCLRYAATRLVAREDTRAILWLGAGGGVRVWVDGELRFHHPYDQLLRPDRYGLELQLAAGPHLLMVAVDDTGGASGLSARLSSLEGGPLPGLRPILDDTPEGRARAARLHPDLYSLAELARLLEVAPRTRADFGKEGATAGLAIGSCAPGYPRLDLGAGVLSLAGPEDFGPRVRAIQRLRIPMDRGRLELDLKAEGERAPLRVAIFDGEERWIASEPTVTDGVVSIDVAAWAGRDLLLILEARCGPDLPFAWKGWRLR